MLEVERRLRKVASFMAQAYVVFVRICAKAFNNKEMTVWDSLYN